MQQAVLNCFLLPRVRRCPAGDCPYDADELVAGTFEPTNTRKLAVAIDFLRGKLAQGSVLSRVVEGEATERGISTRTLTRARKELGVKSSPLGMGKEWALSLPINEALKGSIPFARHE